MRDRKTKEQFVQYLNENPEQRFFQAIRNFTRHYLNTNDTGIENPFIIASDLPPKALYEEDTFHWECDKMLESKSEL